MKVISSFLRIVLSGITALAVLCLIMFGYYFMPLRVNNPNQNTDYVWGANSPWACLTEGISYGVTDANGFINQSVVDNPDILMLGSSHLQTMNVMPNENMCALLNEKLDGKYTAYNMGISGHTLYKVVQYLKRSLSIYPKVPQYVIIETDSVKLDQQMVDTALSGSVPKTAVIDRGLIAQMQKVPYFRQMYHQLDSGMLDELLSKKQNNDAEAERPSTGSQSKPVIDEKPYQLLLQYLQKMQQEYHTNIVVLYHPFEALQADGTVSFGTTEYADAFARHARQCNVGFVDLTPGFEAMYQQEHHVPHGFVTGELGVGHLNRFGHAVAAERLFRYISEREVG